MVLIVKHTDQDWKNECGKPIAPDTTVSSYTPAWWIALMINGQISERDRIDEWDYLVTSIFVLVITVTICEPFLLHEFYFSKDWNLILKLCFWNLDFVPINSLHARTSHKFWGGGQDQGGRRDRFYSRTGAAKFYLIWFHFYS